MRLGFSLVEALVALLVLLVAALALAEGLLFAQLALDRNALTVCLQNAASSAVELKRANPDAPNELSFSCGRFTVRVYFEQAPASGECGPLVAVAVYRGSAFRLEDWACAP
ncbi:MAG: hypothetical protein GXO03_06405 [Aquificae bacterium]|nr:hypothetical protein [Aquificota bacterium]